MSTATDPIGEIANERQRQKSGEGWSHGHDDKHTDESLALAAVCYASPVQLFTAGHPDYSPSLVDPWPRSWESHYDKREKHDKRRRLVIAAALIVAEIERLDRLEPSP